MVLHANGQIEFAYLNVATEQIFGALPLQASWLAGIMPGGYHQIDKIQFSTKGYQGAAQTALIENYYDDFRLYLHRAMQPLAFLIIGSSLFIVGLNFSCSN